MMGLLDYGKAWHFSVAAPADQCFFAFYRAMSTTGKGIKWRLETTAVPVNPDPDRPLWPAAVATYDERAGVGGVIALFSGRGQGMIGTQLTFAVNPESSTGRTECSLWLSKRRSFLDTTIVDTFSIPGYMNDVEGQLRALDPWLAVQKV